MNKLKMFFNNLTENIKTHPKQWGISAVGIICVCIFVATIVKAGVLGNTFNPDMYLNDKNDKNDVSFDSTVFNSKNSDSENSKEMDNEAEDDYSIDKKNDVVSIVDHNRDSNSNSGNESGNGGYVDGDTGRIVVVVDGEGGKSNGNADNDTENESGQGNNDSSANENGNGNANENSNGNNSSDSTNPSNPSTNESDKWKVTDYAIRSSSSNSPSIRFYKYMTVTEQKIKNRLVVTADYQGIENPNETKTEVVTDYEISNISGNYLDKELTDSDVGKTFTITITLGGISQKVDCDIFDDYITYERISVDYKDSLSFAVGDVVDLSKKQDIIDKIDVTAYGYSYNGLQKLTVYHIQNNPSFTVDFHDENGVESENAIITKNVTTANVSVKDGLKNTFSVKNIIKYNVFNYRLTVMYDSTNVLRNIYQDSPTFDLTKSHDNAISTYNEMLERLKNDGVYKTDINGYLKTAFYGWSVYMNNDNYADAITTYTFSENDNSRIIYPLPLKYVSDDFYIRADGTEQILVGYVGNGTVMNIPYGVTKIKIDEDFITTNSANDIEKIIISSTVTSIDFSDISNKFSNLSFYGADKNTVLSTDENGIIYSNDGKTLLRAPVKSSPNIFVPASVTEIANDAFADTLSVFAKNGKKLVLNMEGATPPQFYLENSKYQQFKDAIRININDSIGEITDDYYLKRYAATYGEMLDTAFGIEGFALSNIIYTDSNAQSKYLNIKNDVYSESSNSFKLEFADKNSYGTYNVLNGVTAIGANAFCDSKYITVVNLPNTVTTIEKNAFSTDSTNLCGVQITSDQKINIEKDILGGYDSSKSNFHIYVSAQEESQSNWTSALADSYGDENASQILVITNGEFKYINDCVYLEDDKGHLTLYYVPSSLTEYTAPDNLIAVASFAFNDSKLFSISLPNVSDVSQNAFENCKNLEVLYLPAKALECKCDFDGCDNLKYVILNENNILPLEDTKILEGASYSFDNKIIYQNVDNHNEVIYAVSDISGTISLKDNTTVIKDYAFADCAKLESLGNNQLSSIKVIGEGAFKNCECLGNNGAEIQLSATEIGKNAFENCNSIWFIKLLKGVTAIGERAFSKCNNLLYVYWIADTTDVGDYLFENSDNIILLSLGDESLDVNNENITTIGSHTFENHTSLTSAVFHTSITNIGDYTFANCENLNTTTDTLSDESKATLKIESIGKYSFSGCRSISYIIDKKSIIENLGEGCFKDCAEMLTISIPSTIKEIPDYCFMGCEKLMTVYSNNSPYERIGKNAFSGCIKLQHIYDTSLNVTLKTIDESAFSEGTLNGVYYSPCSELISFEFSKGITKIADNAFYGCSSLATVGFNNCTNLTTIGKNVFADCVSLTECDTFYTKITSVSENMFNGCESLSSVILPASVKSISTGAFVGCDNLDTLYLKLGNVVSLADNAFGDTGNNENLNIYVPKSDGSVIRKAYIDDLEWEKQIFGRGEEIITEIDVSNFVINGGVYKSNGDGTYTLVSVFPTTEGAFSVYALTSVIEPDAFKDCSKLTMVSVPTMVSKIPNGIFESATNVELLVINEINASNAEDGQHPMVANDGSFFGNSTPNENFRIYVNNGAISQYDDWYDAPVYSFGDGYRFDSNVFYGIKETTLSSNNYYILLYIPRSFTGSLSPHNDTREIAESAGENCTNLQSVTLNYLCKTVGKSAFKNCTGLEKFYSQNTTSNQLSTIDDEAFMNCSSLIGKSASYENRLTLPSSVKKIGKRAFMNCTSLSYFSIQGQISEVSDECFSGCTNLSTFTGSTAGLASIQRIGKKAFYDCNKIVSLSWTNLTNLVEVDDQAYEDCDQVILATFADKLERLGDNVFKGTQLQSITFNGSTPPTLGKEIMEESLQENIAIYVPNKDTGTAVLQAYKNAWSSEYPLLANNVQGIDGTQFRMVSNVLYLVNPNNAKELTAIKVVKSLGSASFYNSTSLYCIGIADDALSGCNLIKSISLTANIKTIGDRAFKDCTSLTTLTTNSVLTSIGEEAFKNCTKLQTITIPATVASIGTRAFENNTDLTQIVVKQDVPITLSSKIFGDTVPENVVIYVPQGSLDIYKEKWGSVLNNDYGDGTADSIIKGY